jgi:hypothetical protein
MIVVEYDRDFTKISHPTAFHDWAVEVAEAIYRAAVARWRAARITWMPIAKSYSHCVRQECVVDVLSVRVLGKSES